jgi:hypothetical protein
MLGMLKEELICLTSTRWLIVLHQYLYVQPISYPSAKALTKPSLQTKCRCQTGLDSNC